MAKIVQEVTRASREYDYEVAEAQTRDLDGIIQKLNTTYQQELKEEAEAEAFFFS
jgi:polyhydroxyalkanoate synthesis regulator phasin